MKWCLYGEWEQLKQAGQELVSQYRKDINQEQGRNYRNVVLAEVAVALVAETKTINVPLRKCTLIITLRNLTIQALKAKIP